MYGEGFIHQRPLRETLIGTSTVFYEEGKLTPSESPFKGL